jgi:putative transposase
VPAGHRRVRADGSKELVALADGYREAAGSWGDLLRDCARRGMRAPVLAVGDGALGFWVALREVFPDTREQRDWVHKTANVLAALPNSAHPGAKAALAEIWGAEDKRHAYAAAKRFADLYGAKFRKAAGKITDDLDALLAFYDYPAEHWVHLRTSNPIESTFATVRHRTRVTKAPAAALPASRWPSNSSKPPKTGGARSTLPTSSLSSAPAPASSTANSSNDRPTPRPRSSYFIQRS